MNASTAMEQIITRKEKLPTLPGIAIKILAAVQKERPDLKEIGEILATDPPLSAEVLRLGGRVGSVQMRLVNDEDVLVATGSAFYMLS